VFQVTAFHGRPFNRDYAFVSQAKGAAQGPSETTMAGLRGPFKYIHLLVTYFSKIRQRSVK
jgi:hypothetical protein